jgi:hypothetical protein
MWCTAHKEVTPKVNNLDVINSAILTALNEYPFPSVQDWAERMCIPATIFSESLRKTTNPWKSYVRQSIKIVSISLSSMNSRFTYHQIAKLFDCRKVNRSTSERHFIQAKTVMNAITKNSLGFHTVDVFPKGKTICTTHYGKRILEPVLVLVPKSWHPCLIIHIDNARLHSGRRSQIVYDSNSLRIAPHAPCSSDLASPDSCIVGLLHIRISEVSSEGKFLSLGRRASSRDSQNFEVVSRTTLRDAFRN